MVRVESLSGMPSLSHLRSAESIIFRGVTQHLQYTTEAQRQQLDSYSRPEVSPSENTIAVLIPIGKSGEWWGLEQDQRQAHFQKTAKEGHTTIGLRYVDRVFRKLYHSRYVDPTANYHFLTYFEFYDRYADDFKKLLSELRDATSNPEWNYVNLEFEIWMNKLA
jgi:chlorite dismutase